MFESIASRLSLGRLMYVYAGLALAALATIAAVEWHLLRSAADPAAAGGTVAAMVAVAAMLLVATASILGRFVGRRAERIVAALNAMAQGDLSHRCDVPGRDELAWMAWEYSCARKSFSGMVNEILANATDLASAANRLAANAEQVERSVDRQDVETQHVADAMNAMSTTVHEVARHSVGAAQAAQEADRVSKSGQNVVRSAMDSIESLAREVQYSGQVIDKLKNDSIEIGAVLDVIRGIAEQTNLLALNAAIEAARAGEQGRGFAVVADEVRSLASRTQQSTQEIQTMIERLQAGANDAVATMQRGGDVAETSVAEAGKAREALEAITGIIHTINTMNTQIATTAEQQSQTTAEIHRNVANIRSIATDTSQDARKASAATDELAQLANRLREAASKFRLAV
ncbi:MAG: methyl-accepting chemotaxis protein [Gammaproteobacteria bacterium]